MSTSQQVAIITGAGRGMGAAIARELHERGYQLALMSPSGTAQALAGELGGIGINGSTAVEADIEQLVSQTLEQFGRIDAVVNHTGGPPKGDLVEISDEDWLRGNDLVVMSLVRMCRLVTPVMEKQGRGAILNITSFATFEPSLTFPVSGVYRAGVSAYTKLYSDRYATSGIRMNALLPGFVDSLDHSQATAEMVPMKRLGTVAEIARTAAFLLSDDAGYITGQSIRVDGGITRHM